MAEYIDHVAVCCGNAHIVLTIKYFALDSCFVLIQLLFK